MHEAFARSERFKRQTSLDAGEVLADMKLTLASSDSPKRNVANRELKSALEAAILSLPPKYRTVMMVRDVEELSTAEAASVLEISEEAVKVRFDRARALVRRALYRQSSVCARELFTFRATRCDRVVATVLASADPSISPTSLVFVGRKSPTRWRRTALPEIRLLRPATRSKRLCRKPTHRSLPERRGCDF